MICAWDLVSVTKLVKPAGNVVKSALGILDISLLMFLSLIHYAARASLISYTVFVISVTVW